jgi:glycosyltransferase involved in cell wall biosynthesis
MNMLLHLVPIYKNYSETFIWNLIRTFSFEIDSKVICAKITENPTDEVTLIEGKDTGFLFKLRFKLLCKFKQVTFFNYSKLKRAIKVFNPKIIHAHFGYFIADFCRLSYENPTMNLVISFHGTDLNSIIKNSYGLKRSLKIIAQQKNITCVFPSVFLQNCFSELIGHSFQCSSVVIANSVNSKFVNVWSNKSKPRQAPININKEIVNLLSVGRLTKVKGFKYAIESIAGLKRLGIDVVYTIIGDGEELKALRLLAKKFNVENNIIFAGKCSVDEIINYLLASNIYIQPSVKLDNGQEESFGLAALEAAVSGIPIIVTNVGGLPGVIDKNNPNHYIVPQRDSEELTKNIINVINNPMLMINSDIHNAKFNVDVISDKWRDVYGIK